MRRRSGFAPSLFGPPVYMATGGPFLVKAA